MKWKYLLFYLSSFLGNSSFCQILFSLSTSTCNKVVIFIPLVMKMFALLLSAYLATHFVLVIPFVDISKHFSQARFQSNSMVGIIYITKGITGSTMPYCDFGTP